MLSALILGLAVAAMGDVPASLPAADVPNYSRLGPGLAAAGRPTPEALGKLEQWGFRTVIDLRMPAEGTAGEEAAVKALGLRYVAVPVSAASFSLKDVAAVRKVLEDPSAGPVLLHCASSNRVGAVWAVIESQRGKGLQDALAEGRRAGLRSGPMEDAVRRLLEE
jgi:uncharacterized protein (TIGR01244 family)